MDHLISNLRVLWRAEQIVAELQLRRMVARTGLVAFAALIAVFGLAMLNLAAYLALDPRVGPVVAALMVGFGDLLLAAIALLVAGRSTAGRDLDVAMEVREVAFDAVQADVRSLAGEVTAVRRDLLGLGRSVGGFIRNPLDGALPGLLLPLATFLLRQLRKGDEDGKAGGS